MTSLSGLAVSLGVAAGPSVGRARFDFFAAPDGFWHHAIWGGGIGERVGRGGGVGAGQWSGPYCTIGWDGG